MYFYVLISLGGLAALAVTLALMWRRVVPPNQVHIVNRRKTSTPYGNNQDSGNVYYEFPSWIPYLGTVVVKMPTTIFDIQLQGYQAYDQQKVPFLVDVIAFFQLEDPVGAAKRVEGLEELYGQLEDMLKGVVRKILAGHEVQKIMETRAELSEAFIKEVQVQCKAWGVNANQIEFTDIRDGNESHVITDIMQRKTSLIEKDRRVEVAENMKSAKVAEIEAVKLASLEDVKAKEEVETRDAEREKKVGIAKEQAKQQVQEQARMTTEREVDVQRTKEVGTAAYAKEKAIVEAEAKREQQKIEAEGYRQAAELKAEGDKALVEKVGFAEAEVILKKKTAEAEGELKRAEAVKALNESGKEVELGKAAIEAQRDVGVAIAQAYQNAEIKAYLSNGQGITGLQDLLSAPGGQKLAAFLDTFKGVAGINGLADILKGTPMNNNNKQ